MGTYRHASPSYSWHTGPLMASREAVPLLSLYVSRGWSSHPTLVVNFSLQSWTRANRDKPPRHWASWTLLQPRVDIWRHLKFYRSAVSEMLGNDWIIIFQGEGLRDRKLNSCVPTEMFPLFIKVLRHYKILSHLSWLLSNQNDRKKIER